MCIVFLFSLDTAWDFFLYLRLCSQTTWTLNSELLTQILQLMLTFLSPLGKLAIKIYIVCVFSMHLPQMCCSSPVHYYMKKRTVQQLMHLNSWVQTGTKHWPTVVLSSELLHSQALLKSICMKSSGLERDTSSMGRGVPVLSISKHHNKHFTRLTYPIEKMQ